MPSLLWFIWAVTAMELAGRGAGAALPAAGVAAAPTNATVKPEGRLRVNLSWGHQSGSKTNFHFQLRAQELEVSELSPVGLEAGDRCADGRCDTEAGAGDVDGLALTLRFAERPITPITNLHSIWAHLLANSDADTVRRLKSDPAFRPDGRKLTIQMNTAGTRGFSLTVDQLRTNHAFWVPDLDVFVAAGDPPASFAEHIKQLAPWRGGRVLDEVRRAAEASYEQFTNRWEDMGSPRYRNPASVPPGHIVCVGWDSALHKFGLDRGAGVWNDYGKVDRFRFWFDFGELSPRLASVWKGQQLADGLPLITTAFEQGGVRFEVEQFAYPLHGPPAERRGDMPMVLLQKLRLSELTGSAQTVTVGMTQVRELNAPGGGAIEVRRQNGAWLCEETAAHGTLLAVEDKELRLLTNVLSGAQWRTNTVRVQVDLPANGAREFVVKLPSPLVTPADRSSFVGLEYAAARAATLKFWSDYLARGARFVVPEESVNTLFRANLWHALRLPRRHGGAGENVRIDLPYSNFAYDQNGTPWPVNQAIYVDYMLYDLRGHHALSAEELAVMFRNNQEPNGHIKGYANWGVYTPGMIYTVAQHYLLSGDRASFERLLPQTLRATDWCLAELVRAANNPGPTPGLMLAPLNDLSHDARAWAFNQAYLFAGLDLLGRALADIGHPRAAACQAAARQLQIAIERGFGRASMLSPLVQLRDHTWIPYVPCDALAPRRLLDVWYPTDVDTGALHLSRLAALEPGSHLTTWLLHDHEDNLFFKGWGMANEPVYNQHAAAHLWRDDAPAAIRTFYSMMACAFSHSVFEPVEHRWAWGQYFGPPSTDGAWFELYRNMLLQERDSDTLLLLQATPRRWLEDGKQIRVERAPTYYGPLSMTVESRVRNGRISAAIDLPARRQPAVLLVRFRHPLGQPIRAVSVNGRDWPDFDPQKEWVRIKAPAAGRCSVVARY